MKSACIAILCCACAVLCLPVSGQSAPDAGSIEDVPVIEDEGITVFREKEETGSTVTLDRVSIDEVKPLDLAGFLSSSTGAAVTRNGGYGMVSGISLRGFGSGRIAYFINGIPVNSARSGDFDLSSINIASVERVEIISGAANAVRASSGSIGGAVNIITLPEAGRSLRVRAGVSSLSQLPAGEPADFADTQRYSASVSGSSAFPDADRVFSWQVSGFATRAGNHYRAFDQFGRAVRLDGSEVLDGGAGFDASMALSPVLKVNAAVHAYAAEKNVAGKLYSGYTGHQKDVQSTASVSVDAKRFLIDEVSAACSVSHTFSLLGWESASEDSVHRLHSVSALGNTNLFVSADVQMLAGFDGRFSVLDSTNAHDTVLDADGAFWMGADWRPPLGWQTAGRVLVSPSSRFVVSGSGVVPVPRAGIAWFVTESTALKANVFAAYRLPTLNDRYWTGGGGAGNPDLKSERGFGADIGFSYRRSGVSGGVLSALVEMVELSAHASSLEDAIIWASESEDGESRLQPMNLGEAWYWGASARWESGKIGVGRVSALYSFLDSRIRTGRYTERDRLRVPYQSMHRADLSLSARFGGLFASVSAHAESERWTTMYNTISLPPFATLSASLSHTYSFKSASAELYLKAENLAGASYQTIEGYPMPGAQLTAGLSVSFD